MTFGQPAIFWCPIQRWGKLFAKEVLQFLIVWNSIFELKPIVRQLPDFLPRGSQISTWISLFCEKKEKDKRENGKLANVKKLLSAVAGELHTSGGSLLPHMQYKTPVAHDSTACRFNFGNVHFPTRPSWWLHEGRERWPWSYSCFSSRGQQPREQRPLCRELVSDWRKWKNHYSPVLVNEKRIDATGISSRKLATVPNLGDSQIKNLAFENLRTGHRRSVWSDILLKEGFTLWITPFLQLKILYPSSAAKTMVLINNTFLYRSLKQSQTYTCMSGYEC